MLNLWIGNLGKYNEGELKGGWIQLPVSQKEMNDFLRETVGIQLTQKEVDEALAKDGVCYEEYYIGDYETDLPINVGEYDNPRLLNLVSLASQNVDDMEKVSAYIDYLGLNSEKDYVGICNVMLQEDEIPFYPYLVDDPMLSNEEKFGYMMAENTELQTVLDENNISSYFDYEKYGRDCYLSGDYELLDNGFIELDEQNVDTSLYTLTDLIKELDLPNKENEVSETVIEGNETVVEETESEDDMEM